MRRNRIPAHLILRAVGGLRIRVSEFRPIDENLLCFPLVFRGSGERHAICISLQTTADRSLPATRTEDSSTCKKGKKHGPSNQELASPS